MLNKIKEMLSNDQEVKLECIDRDLFINIDDGWFKKENKGILSSDLIVAAVNDNNTVIEIDDCDYRLTIDELQYFRIVEAKPTLDDLIIAVEAKPKFNDVISAAVKAAIDGALAIRQLDEECLSVISRDGKRAFERWRSESNAKDIANFINFIKSLYTETFMIESVDDTDRINDPASIKLLNGEECEYIGGKIKHGCATYEASYLLLKGATVTQKRCKQ